ncbi:hypothetical protein [Micromonospora sp. NPDC047074]|uniref:hypothetical protein n=1 Tax=Micromonospora sp. NPDC047074 TaxID=3154339 RepID=UPI0033EB032D
MPSVASDPFWSVTLRSLRELTRLAVAALVLAVGLGGATAAPAPAPADALGSVATSVAQPPHRDPAAEQVIDTAPPVAGTTALPEFPRADIPTDVSVVATGHPSAHPVQPGRGAPARRGPPTA